MFEYLSQQSTFVIFGRDHALSLITALILGSMIIYLASRYLDQRQKIIFGLILALLPLIGVVGRMVLLICQDKFTVQEELPLYICRIVTFFMPWVMYTMNRRVFGVLYFWVLAGTINAILTPDMEFGFPHWSAFQYWIVHAGLVITVLYGTLVLKMRPFKMDILYAFICGNIYIVSVHIINILLKSNYSYTMFKPPGGSILDHFGPWPWYLLTGQLLAVFLFMLVYSPYRWRDRRLK